LERLFANVITNKLGRNEQKLRHVAKFEQHGIPKPYGMSHRSTGDLFLITCAAV